MKALILIFMICLAGCLLVAGCTQTSPTQPATPIPTSLPQGTTAVPQTTSPGGMGTPEPITTLPPESELIFQITSNGNTANPLMIVAIMGGAGMTVDSQVDVTLTQPDGTSQTQTMVQPFSSGMNVQFPCSTFQNRIQIWVTSSQVGKAKVYDEIVHFQSINP